MVYVLRHESKGITWVWKVVVVAVLVILTHFHNVKYCTYWDNLGVKIVTPCIIIRNGLGHLWSPHGSVDRLVPNSLSTGKKAEVIITWGNQQSQSGTWLSVVVTQ